MSACVGASVQMGGREVGRCAEGGVIVIVIVRTARLIRCCSEAS